MISGKIGKAMTEQAHEFDKLFAEKLGVPIDKLPQHRRDLKNYTFTCDICKLPKSADEARLVLGPIETEIKEEGENIICTGTQRVGLVCRDCVDKLYVPTYTKVAGGVLPIEGEL